MPRPTLVLIRHGETEWNAVGRFQGRGDSPLTAQGLSQARATAAMVASLGIRHAFSSPLGRARATAALVAGACGVAVEIVPELAEVDFGECSTLTRTEVQARWPTLAAERAADPWHHRWPGGESYADLAARVELWLAREPFAGLAGPAAIVSHQTLLRGLLVALAGWPRERARGAAFPAGVAWRLDADGRLDPVGVTPG